jgi:hypothetical protein
MLGVRSCNTTFYQGSPKSNDSRIPLKRKALIAALEEQASPLNSASLEAKKTNSELASPTTKLLPLL